MAVLALVIAVLGYSSFRGVYAYRDLAMTLSSRASEMPLTSELTLAIDQLRNDQSSLKMSEPLKFRLDPEYEDYRKQLRFSQQLQQVGLLLARYQARLEAFDKDDRYLSDRSAELEHTNAIRKLFTKIYERHSEIQQYPHAFLLVEQSQDLDQLSSLAHELPTFLAERMASFRDDVRNRYRTWIALTWGSAILAVGLLIGLVVYAKVAVIRPFKELLSKARRVGAGDFNVRLTSESKDELAELANAINLGVESFLNIQRDLNQQVQERSREVIRNEQLASVGFLAAGVAHEINNPLASIAWSAEALESRLHKLLPPELWDSDGQSESQELQTLKNYLKRIQDEAFRCKGITEKLLDFSRLNHESKRSLVDMQVVIDDVVSMVRHLGQFRSKKILFQRESTDYSAWVSAQEMKQVVLNLLTNSLESIDPKRSDGVVSIELSLRESFVVVSVQDNGCGMTEEVQNHMFEPFFTKRLDGRGTGLGLSITSRIIADHGGRIIVTNLGLGVGSRFEVLLPREAAYASQTVLENNQSNAAIGKRFEPQRNRFSPPKPIEQNHAA
ncbi:MAG: ATP-binding protein [Pirellula sp.]|nr:ATP-binding protein [Pirellula sp.]